MKVAKADVGQIRQTTQYSCCAASIASALKAHGKNVTEEELNKVLNAAPMAGASWESMLATVQYFGLRGSLVVPATPRMLKAWTDKGIPVVIAWNPEGRPWSHASTVFDVTESPEGLMIHIMDPNIPNPSKTVRIMGEDEFCQKWAEKVTDSLIMRRPAMAVEREITPDGKQIVASGHKKKGKSMNPMIARVAARHIQAFQYAFAQAFADQVGIPAHVSIPKLNGLIIKAFTNALTDADQSMDNLKVTSSAYVELEYGPTRSYYEYRGGPKESPDERDTKEFKVPDAMSGTVTFKLTVRDLAVAFQHLNQFFNHHRNEIEAFFKDPKNLRLIEKYFNWVLKADTSILEGIDFAIVDEDAMNTTFDEGMEDGITGGSGGPTQTVTEAKADFKVNNITVEVDVDFTFDTDSSDFELEDGYGEDDGPDEDDDDDREYEPDDRDDQSDRDFDNWL